MASDSDFEPHPELVRGYIGPTVLGPNSPQRVVDEEGNTSGSVRYLVDPRVVEGTVWVTGANAEQRHVLNLVMGRDFTAVAPSRAAEVREGDLAPDGSGPLHLERSIEIGHIFQLGRKYAKALGLTVTVEEVSGSQPSGQVTAVEPGEGSKVDKNSTVKLKVSKGSASPTPSPSPSTKK